MKRIIAFLCVVCITLTFAGCDLKNGSGENLASDEMSSKSDDKTANQVTIYKIYRDEFELFLKSPSLDTIKSNDFKKYEYSKYNEWHNGGSRFLVTKPLMELMRDYSRLEALLAENGINAKVDNAVIVDAPLVPKTILLETNKGSACFVIGESANDDEYTYEFCSMSDYAAKYSRTTATVIADGKKIESQCETVLYHNYADVPLMAVLKGLGAEVGEMSNGIAELSIDNKSYLFNSNELSLEQIGGQRGNLLFIAGGYTFVYSQGEEIMIDTDTLYVVFRDMGLDITIKCDREKNEVSIDTKD